MAPWKNWISFTTMKLRKSLVKPVTRQNILSCLVLPPEIVMHDAFNVILWTFTNICDVVHDDLGWKNWTTRYNCRFSAASLALWVIFVCRKCPPIYALSCMTISGERTKQLDIFCRVTGFTIDFRLPQTSADVCVGHDDLGWKNRTTRCNRFWRAGCSRLEYVNSRLVY